MSSTGTLYGVGVGPGDPELVTLKAVRIAEGCPVIATPRTASGATTAYDIMRQAARIEGKKTLYLDFAMTKDAAVLRQSHQRAAQLVIDELEAGNDVALLNLGDVSIYATFNYVKDIVEQHGLPVVMVPGVPSFCAVAATLSCNLTPCMETPLHIIPAGNVSLEQALELEGTKVVMKAGKPLAQVKETLRAKGMYEKASLVHDCGMPSQTVAASLDDADETGRYFTTMVVRP